MGVKHIKIVVSDCHLGTGANLPGGGVNPLEDFRKDEKFVEMLDHYTTHPEFKGAKLELVINGDFFDILMVRTSSMTPYEIIEPIAVHKIKRIIKGHPKVIGRLKKFIEEQGHPIKYIWGNHDAGIWWPAVQLEIKDAISQKIEFLFVPYEFDGVRIEHGHQYEIMNHFDESNMFLKVKGRPVLNYPFGSFFVAGFLAPLRLRRSYITQVIPFSKFIRWALVFDFWFALVQGTRAMWFFFKMRFIYHPLRFAKISKTFRILYELFNRPKFAKIAPEILKKTGAKILLMGHNHQATHRFYRNGTQYVNTGTWTDVTSFDPASLGRTHRATYAVIEYPEGVVPGQGVTPIVKLQVWKGEYRIWDLFES